MSNEFPGWHGTTIIGVKKGGQVVIAGDGQVSLGQTVIKGTASFSAPASNWPRTGAPTNTCKSSRRC